MAEVRARIEAQWASAYKGAERASAVKAACDKAIVSAIAERVAGRGWVGIMMVREAAKTAAVSSAADSLSARAIERGRGRALILREYVAIIDQAINASGLVVDRGNRRMFIASSMSSLMLHPWFMRQYGGRNQTRYFKVLVWLTMARPVAVHL